MALEYIGKSLCFHMSESEEEYLEKRKKILESFDCKKIRRVGDMIYCRKCHYPKMFDDPDHWAAMECNCKCEVDEWEKRTNPPRNFIGMKKVYAGDYNPFDGAGR